MGVEIERKFLVAGNDWRRSVRSSRQLKQGYLAVDGGTTVRVRTDGQSAWLTIKGSPQGLARPEFEYEIPAAEASALLDLCQGRTVEKTRHLIPTDGHVWEVDEFEGRNSGLIVAEIELRDAAEKFARPAWLGAEVTEDPRYLNASLAVHPFSQWAR